MSDLPDRVTSDVGALYAEVRAELLSARASVARSVNEAMVRAYWSIGGMIERHVGGVDRSDTYGKSLAVDLAARLSEEFGRGFDASNLRYMRLFFNAFEICDAPRHKSSAPVRLDRPEITVELSWTHYRLLTRVHRAGARWFYMNEAIRGRWSTRELERQISTRYFERGLGEQPLPAGTDVELADPQALLRDPYVLEFVGLPDRYSYTERELEQALIDQLQAFLLELGRGFSFVGRQQRVTVDGEHFYVDYSDSRVIPIVA